MSEIWAFLSAIFAMAAALLLLPGAGVPQRRHWSLPGWLHRLQGGRDARTVEEGADAAVLLDLTAALLTAGVGVEAALSRLASTVPGAQELDRVHNALLAGTGWEQATHLVAEHQQLASFCDHLGFAYATGAPSATMLEAVAEQARVERRQDSERRAEELGVKMMLPLGACFLPAFILLGVVPVVLSLLPEALGA